mmetsp:Transcript_20069/g.23117  ORF Transcript_20069/g.23117 Transcript_20069/m.23117 type:complete len:161 (+) Transcript_20069:39-521(+)
MEEISEVMRLEIPPTMLGRIVKDKYDGDVLTTQKFKTEYGKCIKAFVHFLTSMASEDCKEHGRAKVSPANLKNVLNDFNMELLYADIDIKDTPTKKATKKLDKPKDSKSLKRNYSKLKQSESNFTTERTTESFQEPRTMNSDYPQPSNPTDQMLIETENN